MFFGYYRQSERILIKQKGKLFRIFIIFTYAPANQSTEEDIEQFSYGVDNDKGQ